MKYPRLLTVVLCALLVQGATIYDANAGHFNTVEPPPVEDRAQTSVHYKIDAAQSKFMARAFSGGALWFKGHDHFVAVRDFTGDLQLTSGTIIPASLEMTVRADSLVETRDKFTEPQKQIINKELREIVLETAKYPEITFKSTEVTIKLGGGGQFSASVGGNLALHGVTRHITIPVEGTASAATLQARGEFMVSRDDYNIKATSAFHGMVRVRDKIKLTFDIIAHQS